MQSGAATGGMAPSGKGACHVTSGVMRLSRVATLHFYSAHFLLFHAVMLWAQSSRIGIYCRCANGLGLSNRTRSIETGAFGRHPCALLRDIRNVENEGGVRMEKERAERGCGERTSRSHPEGQDLTSYCRVTDVYRQGSSLRRTN
jgi:hypothetical protein